jgi:hypothetical protein
MRGQESNLSGREHDSRLGNQHPPRQDSRPATRIGSVSLGNAPQSLFHPGGSDEHGEDAGCNRRSRQKRRIRARIHRGKIKTTREFCLSFKVSTGPLAAPATNPVVHSRRNATADLERALRRKQEREGPQSHQGIGVLQGALRRGARAPRTPPRPARDPIKFDTRHNNFGVGSMDWQFYVPCRRLIVSVWRWFKPPANQTWSMPLSPAQ